MKSLDFLQVYSTGGPIVGQDASAVTVRAAKPRWRKRYMRVSVDPVASGTPDLCNMNSYYLSLTHRLARGPLGCCLVMCRSFVCVCDDVSEVGRLQVENSHASGAVNLTELHRVVDS